VQLEKDLRSHEPAAPVGRASAGRWIIALGVIATALVLAAAAAAASPTTKFTSKEYGYSLILRGGASHWTSSFAFVSWSIGAIATNSPAFDTFTDMRVNRLYLIAARRPPTGSTLEQWTAFFISARPSDCRKPAPLSSSTLSGAPARILTFSCTDGYNVIAITALHDHRGYFMIVASPTSSSRASDHNAFNAAQRTFRFLPK
jgi:hypothetical protein